MDYLYLYTLDYFVSPTFYFWNSELILQHTLVQIGIQLSLYEG